MVIDMQLPNIWPFRRGTKAVNSPFGDERHWSDWGGSRTHTLPGSAHNWAKDAGDLWLNPVIAAAIRWSWANCVLAPFRVMRREPADDTEVPVEDHPLDVLLDAPNSAYDGTVLKQAVILSLIVDGNAYCAVEKNGRGEPGELWWLPHGSVKPKRDKGSTEWMTHYEYTVGGQRHRLDKDNVLHIRHGIDPASPLLGLSPAAAALRAICTTNLGATYAATILRRFGVPGGVASPKDGTRGTVPDPKLLKAKLQGMGTGDHAGEFIVLEDPIDIHWPQVTPQRMALDTILDRPEADVGAAIGIPLQVLGIHAGRLSKTYANQQEAREAAWEEFLLPLLWLIASQAGRALLPMFGDAKGLRLGVNIDDVRAMQPDVSALHDRARADWEKNLIDRATWKRLVNMEVNPDDEGVYFSDTEAGAVAPPVSAKRLDRTRWDDRVTKELEALRLITAKNGGVAA